MGTVHDVVVAVLAIGGALFVLVSAVGMLRTRDALSRVNVMSAATGVGMPAIFTAVWLHDVAEHGLSWTVLIRVVVAVGALIVISSVASNALGRAAYRSGAPIDPATSPNELAQPPSAARPSPVRHTGSPGDDVPGPVRGGG